MTARDLACVALSAGAGRRLAPLSYELPKALCPVANVALLDRAIDRLAGVLASSGGAADATGIAVNVHHHAALIETHLARESIDVHVSREAPEALGTAGALGALRPWIAGRDVLVTNTDAWLGGASQPRLDGFFEGWDGERVRLLCVRDGERGDFGDLRYAGVCLMPAARAAALEATPSGLYERCWRGDLAAGRLDLVEHAGPFIDTGTPLDYLRANLAEVAASGGSLVDESARIGPEAVVERSVVGADAQIEGRVSDAVVWAGAEVRKGELLDRGVRSCRFSVLVR